MASKRRTKIRMAPGPNWMNEYTSPFKIRKIDSRNKLYGEFDFQVRISTGKFLEVRDWCWNTWGGSIEYFWYNDYRRSPACNSSWCFDTDFSNARRHQTGLIYLATNQEMDLFYLKWGSK